MEAERVVPPGRLRRLADELADEGVPPTTATSAPAALLDEVDYALRPAVHERRVPSYGAIVVPAVDATGWEPATNLRTSSRRVDDLTDADTRRFADGLSSWAVRHEEGITELVVFDRSAASERDLVVIAEASGGVIVQRHPNGIVRLVGAGFGVLRWVVARWQHEPRIDSWVHHLGDGRTPREQAILDRMVSFAVHDLGARGIGALLVYRPDDSVPGTFELRARTPPPLRIDEPADLAPLHHVLGQVDGAAVFDRDGVLRRIGVRLVPSSAAEADVDALRGTRHTSARRYSYDDPTATVIVVSEDGPVTVLRNGEPIGRSPH